MMFHDLFLVSAVTTRRGQNGPAVAYHRDLISQTDHHFQDMWIQWIASDKSQTISANPLLWPARP
jgi:hypothetical protein